MSTEQAWVDAFQTQAPARAAWLAHLRQQALARFADEGWPGMRHEAWRHTALAPLTQAATSWLHDGGLTQPGQRLPAAVLQQAQHVLHNLRATDASAHWLVFVDGVYAPQLSRLDALPPGARLTTLSDALTTDADALEPYYGDATQGAPLMALNAALAQEGAFLHLAPGVVVEQPVHWVFLSVTPGRVRCLRNVLALQTGACVTVAEHFIGLDGTAGLTHTATQATVAQDAQFTHLKLQQEAQNAFHLGTTTVVQHSGAQHESHSLSLGAHLARHDINTHFHGKRCHVLLNGLYLINGKRHVDHHTLIDHTQSDSVSQEYYRGILADQARGVFRGRILVAQGADRTDAIQRADSLLLSRMARSDTQPELEIYADDVKCAHGATVGQLDEDSLFYLRTRGLPQEQAHSLLVYAFAMETLARIASPALRTHATRAVQACLPGGDHLGDIPCA